MNIQITDHSKEVLEALESRIPVALDAVGLKAEELSKKLCPVRTGRLRNSITHARDEEAAYIGTNVEYAPYVELGTSKQTAKPYLKPAIVNNVGIYKKIFEYYLNS